MSIVELETFFTWFGIDYVVNPHKRIYWGFIASSLLIAMFYLWYKKEHARTYLSPSYWLHPSARLDYGYFLIISIIKSLIIFPLMLGAGDTAWFTVSLLNDHFGYHPATDLNRSLIIVLYSFTLFVVGDFTRYCLHRWLHSNNFLWQFHKVHHSATVLTPFTFYRVHPVENILFGIRYALTTGIITGIFIYFFGARLQIMDVLGVNVFIFISLLLGANLRHSPIYLRYPALLEKWLISPAQHQHHHSIRGLRYNYGGVLAIWDRVFHSLHLSEDTKPLDLGLNATDRQEFNKVNDLLFKPFAYFWILLKR